MKKLMILAAVLGILAMASMSFAQNIGITFDESGTLQADSIVTKCPSKYVAEN